jgi:hypothetical protein
MSPYSPGTWPTTSNEASGSSSLRHKDKKKGRRGNEAKEKADRAADEKTMNDLEAQPAQ